MANSNPKPILWLYSWSYCSFLWGYGEDGPERGLLKAVC